MDHHTVADINADMAGPRCVVGSLEENQVTGLCFTWTDDRTVIHQSVCCHAAYIPAVSAVIDDIADKSRAVKAGRVRRAAPDIWVSQIFLRLADHVGKMRCSL